MNNILILFIKSFNLFLNEILTGVIAGQWRRSRDGRDIAVRAVRQRAGSAGAQRPLAALLPQGDLLPVARPHRGPRRNQLDLPTGDYFRLNNEAVSMPGGVAGPGC